MMTWSERQAVGSTRKQSGPTASDVRHPGESLSPLTLNGGGDRDVAFGSGPVWLSIGEKNSVSVMSKTRARRSNRSTIGAHSVLLITDACVDGPDDSL